MLVRSALGAQLRRRRVEQRRTLREVSGRARVSLGYLSEVERGQKEASSELLASICDALDMRLSTLLQDTSDDLALAELVEGAALTGSSSVRALPDHGGSTSVEARSRDADHRDSVHRDHAPTPLPPAASAPDEAEVRTTGVAVDCAA